MLCFVMLLYAIVCLVVTSGGQLRCY